MKLINLEQLRQLPAGSIYMRYYQHGNGDLTTKGDGPCTGNDIVDCSLVGVSGVNIDHKPPDDTCTLQMEVIQEGSFEMDPKMFGRNWYDEKDQFILYEEADIDYLIDRLIRARVALKTGDFDKAWSAEASTNT